MKQIVLFLTIALWSSLAFAQVGINTEDPQAALDIVAGTTPSEKDGLLIPRLDEYPTGVTAAQDGMLVFITGNGAPAKGFYYYNHTATNWAAVTGASGGTLDQAYDFGGAGAGRIINTDSGDLELIGVNGLRRSGSINTGFISGANINLNASGTGTISGMNNTFNSTSISVGGVTGFSNTFNQTTSNTTGYSNGFNGYNVPTGRSLTGYQNTYGSGNFVIGYGFRNTMPGAFTVNGNYVGFSSNLQAGGSGSRTGFSVAMFGPSTGLKTGARILIDAASPGQHYGIYADVRKATEFAGFFIGRTSFGNSDTTGRYIMPLTDGTAGQVMATDGNGNVSFQDEGPSSGTLDQAYDFGGPGGGRVINATNGALSILGLDGMIVRGTFGDGATITASGSGPRMLFNPRKAAFRAGHVSSTQWNDTNVGEFSVAFGLSTIASANGAAAFGVQTLASAFRATAFGFQTIASGIDATSFGNNTTASGNSATAFGSNTEASGSNALAFGTNTEASGSESIASGTGTIASGDRATAFGSSTTASGGLATSFGLGTNASGGRATAFGRFTTAAANEATAFGFQTEASGVQATAFGNDTTASGENATAFGDRSIALGENATAFGTISRAQGDHSIAVGNNARANGGASFAQGSGTLATGFASAALGFGTRAVSSNETALGSFNELTASNRNFVVGNGISDLSRSNAFEVYNSGLIRINDSYSLPITDGTNGQAMITDGVGNLSFQNVTSTLDQAYDSGGAGAGRTINVDNGAVVIQGNAGGATATTSAQLILTETQANDFSRIRLTNSVETDNIWTIATRTDNDAASSRMNFNHTGAGDMFQLFGDNTIEMETYVGVNQANPDHAIHLPNNAFNNIGTGLAFAWDTYSDKRIKSQFKSIENALELLIKTKPTRYKQHNSSFKNGSLFIEKSGTNTLGFVAQELYEILPEAVNKPEDETNTLWSVNYTKVIPVAVKAIQELHEKVEALSYENALLKDNLEEITVLKNKLLKYEILETRLEALEQEAIKPNNTSTFRKK